MDDRVAWRGNSKRRRTFRAKVLSGDGETVPSDTEDAADRWRALASEARARAAEMSDPEAKQIMLSIAEGYERLARRAEAGKNPKNSR